MRTRASRVGRGKNSAASDEQLVDRVRRGDQAAYGELYRRHRRSARSTAGYLAGSGTDADDVVAEAFASVLVAIGNGRGPRTDFRRYLLACVRNGCRVRQRTVPYPPEDDRFERSDGRTDVLVEDPERYVEADTVARAFAGLAPRWQQMLWSTAVEERSPSEVGEQMSLSPNAAAQLAHRARQAFATAYLNEHVVRTGAGECDRCVAQIAAYVRGQLSPARAAAVEDHLAVCADCTQVVADLRDVNASLRTLLPAPLAAVAGSGPVAELALIGGATFGVPSGLPFAGLLVKAVAGVMLLAPVFVTGVSMFGGGADDRRAEPAPMELEALAAARPTPRDGPSGTSASMTSASTTSASTTAAPTTAALATATPAAGLTRGVAVRPPEHPPQPILAAVPEPVELDRSIEPRGLPGLLGLDRGLERLDGAVLGAAVERVDGLLGDAVDLVAVVIDDTVDHLDGLLVDVTSGVVSAVAGAVDHVASVPLLDAAPDYLDTAGSGVVDDVASAPLLDAAPDVDVVVSVPALTEPATATAVSAPAVAVPSLSTPAVSVTVPAVTTPAVSTPAVSTPAASTPVVTVPSVSVPAVSVSPVTVTVPAVSVPAVSLPPVTVTVPVVSLPPVTVTVPAITVALPGS